MSRALKRLERLQARLPEDLQGEFEKATSQLQRAIETVQHEHQGMADQISAHQAAIDELRHRTDELGQANANQARVISALTQTEVAGVGDVPIIIPTDRPLPSFEPSISPEPSPTPSAGPSPSPSPPPAATPVAIATAFQQAFAAMQAAPGVSGPTIRSMDVQVKGLVQVTSDGSQTTLTFPTPDNPLGGDVLSTVSMSLGAVPELTPSPPPS